MTTSERFEPTRLSVWVWLPDADLPVVAGALNRAGRMFAGQEVLTFTYARSYRERPEAISLFSAELPLPPDGAPGTFDPTRPDDVASRSTGARPTRRMIVKRRSPLPMHGCLRDAGPDAWGRRVINLRLLADPDAEVSELSYLAASSSDRIGALDFQASPSSYLPRGEAASLEDLLRAAELVEAGHDLPPELAAAALHGTSIGGARPKALLDDDGRALIAKFSSTTDTRPVVQAEAAAMLLAARSGIRVAAVETRTVAGKEVLLVERFDRGPEGSRRLMVSALTVLGYAEMESRHASYAELAETIRTGPWTEVASTLRELYTRLVFSVCVSNTDDHLRNHAAFWDGSLLTLTPAYDLSPGPRSTSVASQAIAITRDGRRSSQLWLCREVAGEFLLSAGDAEEIIDRVVTTIRRDWTDVCDQVGLTTAERRTLWQREFLHPYTFYPEP